LQPFCSLQLLKVQLTHGQHVTGSLPSVVYSPLFVTGSLPPATEVLRSIALNSFHCAVWTMT
jgi:hypothetical protein